MSTLQGSRFRVLRFIVVAAVMLLSGSAWGGIVVTGSTMPVYGGMGPDPWDVTGDMVVGYQDNGTLTVNGGSGVTVTGGSTLIGSNDPAYSGVVGTVWLAGPGSTWVLDLNEDFVVGPLAEGDLTIEGGATLTSGTSIIGGQPVEGEGGMTDMLSGTGSVSLSGDGSRWDSDWLVVGARGTGSLTVTGGADVVSAGTGLVGVMTDGTGTVAVTGADSTWMVNNNADLVIGAWGSGTLNISDGGRVDSTRGWVGGTDPVAVELDDQFLMSQGNAAGTGTVSVTGENSQWNVDEALVVGAWGTGDLTIADQGEVTVPKMYIGGMPITLGVEQPFSRDLLADGTGTVTVTGAGSLEVTGDDTLFVGYSGTGTLSVEADGDVTAESVVVGGAPDADGTVVVSGGGSTLTADHIDVGFWGTGRMTISAGGEVLTDYLSIGGGDASGVTDLPQAILDDFGEAAGTGTVMVTDGGSSLTVTGDQSLYVGYSGGGGLSVNLGGYVSSQTAGIGVQAGSQGGVVVGGHDDANVPSTWDNTGSMFVGGYGSGSLRIEDGGQVHIGESLYVGGFDPCQFGGDGDLFGNEPNGTGEVTVTDAGSLLDVTGITTLYVGYSGNGTLYVFQGAQVNTNTMVVGAGPGAVGTVVIDDPNSTISAGEGVVVGAWGEGHLGIGAAGSLTTGGLYIGGFDPCMADPALLAQFGDPNGTGGVLVSGPGSSLTVTGTGTIVVGAGGTGTLGIQDGATVISEDSFIGGYLTFDHNDVTNMDDVQIHGGTGSVEVRLPGTTWQSNVVVVGTGGSGTLDVTEGGQVSDYLGIMGFGPDAAGRATISGPNSVWTNVAGGGGEGDPYNGTLIVGGWGQGDLMVSNGGRVDTVTMYIGGFDLAELGGGEPPTDWGPDVPAGTGTVTVTGTDSMLQVLGGNTTYVGFTGDGTLNILNGGHVVSDAAIVGVLEGSHGLVTVDGTGSTWSIAGGGGADASLDARGEGEVLISNGGRLEASGDDAVLAAADGISVGSEGQGRMVVSNDALVMSEDGVVGGYDPQYDHIEDYFDPNAELGTGTGTVVVSGGGSSWEADNLAVGFSGSGTMDVNDSGKVMTYRAFMGVMPDSVGTARVSGSGSRWESVEVLGVGLWGQGDLTISDGALVDSGEIYIGGAPIDVIEQRHVHVHPDGGGGIIFGALAAGEAYDPNRLPAGVGRVTVTGEGSELRVLGLESLYVGYSGTGTLDVNDGGYVESETAGVAVLPGSTGSVTVDGVHSNEVDVPSEWYNHGSMFVGGYGDGSLMVSNGGIVTSEDAVYIGGFDIEDFDVDVQAIGYDPNGTGTVTVTDDGSLLETGGMVVGVTGGGGLDILDGGEVRSVVGLIGFGPDSVGEATVDGEGSVWHMTSVVEVEALAEGEREDWSILGVGIYGPGHLTISDGGQVTVADAVVGGFDLDDIDANQYYALWGDTLGTGIVTVTGADSRLDVLYDLCIGHTGMGILDVNGGGQVASEDGFIGDYADAVGLVTVTGQQSQWTLADNLYVGYEGMGILDVNDGGRVVVDENLYIGGDSEGSWGTGILAVNDTGEVLVGAELYVWETGTLTGDGTVTVWQPTTLYNYGTIAPGNDGIGTLTVNGNVVFEPNSIYSVQISNSTSDRLEVNGNVLIDGGTVRVDSQGTIIGVHDYEIIAANVVSGEFDVLDTALLDFTVTDANLGYDESSVWLHLVAANFNDPNLARTYNQRQVAGGLQQIAGEDPDNPITDALQGLPDPDRLRHAYDELSGQTRPPLGTLTAAGTSRFLGTVTSRLQTVQGGLVDTFTRPGLLAMAGPDSTMGDARTYDVGPQGQTFGVGKGSSTLSDVAWGLWGRAYGLYGDRETEFEAPGYNYSIFGGSVGLDYQFNDVWLGGLVVGMANGDVDYAGSRDNAEFDAKHVGLYGSAAWEKWYVDSVATLARLEYDTERFVDLLGERLTGSFSGYELAAYAEVGRKWQVGPDLLLQPLASVQYSHLTLDDYTEHGGVSALSFDTQTQESVKGSLGARLTRTLIDTMGDFRANVQLRGRWVHEFGDNRATVDTSFASNPAVVFTVRDAEIDRDSAVLGVGLSGDLSKHTRVYVDYDTRLNSDESVHVIGASLQYRW